MSFLSLVPLRYGLRLEDNASMWMGGPCGLTLETSTGALMETPCLERLQFGGAVTPRRLFALNAEQPTPCASMWPGVSAGGAGFTLCAAQHITSFNVMALRNALASR